MDNNIDKDETLYTHKVIFMAKASKLYLYNSIIKTQNICLLVIFKQNVILSNILRNINNDNIKNHR
jgi:hypothetical protein